MNKRIATTTTNVKEGTIGADHPHSFAVLDAVDTIREQVRLLRETGKITSGAEWEAQKLIDEVRKIAWAPVDAGVKATHEKFQAFLAATK